jgi:hypothetical protein
VNSKSRDRSFYLQVLLGCLLCVFLTGLFFVITFKRPSVLGMGGSTRANSTRTALALTSRALYGPFPTATGPTLTPSKTRTTTPTPTITASNTVSPTPIHYFIDTATPRTAIPHSGTALIPVSTQPPILPTNPPPVQPSSPPIQPTPCRNPQGHPIPCH